MTTAAWLSEREEPTPAELRDQQHLGRASTGVIAAGQPYLCDDPWEGKPVPHWHGLSDAGSVATAVALLACTFGGLLLLAFLSLGQDLMCDVHDQGLRYCPGYEATR